MATAEEKKILQKMKKSSKGAYKRAKTAEPKEGFIILPTGINQGIARFTDYKLALDKNQNPYLNLVGTVLEPEEYEGARATTQHFLSSNERKTVEQKYENLFGDLQLLGIDTVHMDDNMVLEECLVHLAELKKRKTAYHFRTWKPDDSKNTDRPMVFIQGLVKEEHMPDEDEEEYESEEDDEESEEEEELESEESEEEDDNEGDEEEVEEDEGDEEDWVPEKEDVYNYSINSKALAFPCEVTTVNRTKETVGLKRQKDDKVFKDVSWDKLQDAEE